MISTNELSFPMPAANLIAQRDPMRFVDTALYADDCAAESRRAWLPPKANAEASTPGAPGESSFAVRSLLVFSGPLNAALKAAGSSGSG